MDFFDIIFSNSIIDATFLAWFVAQFLKVVIVLLTERKMDFSRFVGSGGMPSSHSSTVCALTVCILRLNGISSVEFALSFIFAIIVMYDAAGVRRAAGQQAAILNKMIENWDSSSDDFFEVKLKELLGHTPVQVILGAVIGIVIALFFPL